MSLGRHEAGPGVRATRDGRPGAVSWLAGFGVRNGACSAWVDPPWEPLSVAGEPGRASRHLEHARDRQAMPTIPPSVGRGHREKNARTPSPHGARAYVDVYEAVEARGC